MYINFIMLNITEIWFSVLQRLRFDAIWHIQFPNAPQTFAFSETLQEEIYICFLLF